MKTYNQLTRDQRYQINYWKAMGLNGKEIAHEIGVHKSTISRELKRNGCEHSYRPKQADEKAMSRKAKTKPRITESTWELVEEKLRDDWSPEQVSGWLKRYGIRISHEWIYRHILVDKHSGGNLYIHLRCQKKRRKRYGKYNKRGMIPNRISIEERPKVVELRERLGDWEVDTLVGKGHRGALVSLVDRKSRFTLIRPVGQRGADSVSQVVISLLTSFTTQVHTITGDNGKEFAKHEQVTEALQAMFFFAHPYSAWERGTSENTNGLIRQYFPKDTNFTKITDTQATFVANKLNHRPRKCLGFYTPFEVHLQYTVALES
jgi:IS30 family transposase